MPLKENIKKYRLERKVTLEELAKFVGVSKPTLQRYESGVISNIPSENIEKIAERLNVTPSALYGWEDFDKHFNDDALLSKEVITFESFFNYLKSLDYNVMMNQSSEVEYTVTIHKDDLYVEYTKEEFEKFKRSVQESIAFELWKKNQKGE